MKYQPPHIHAVHNEYEVLIDFEKRVIYSGGLPSRQLKIVMAWLTKNLDWALALFFESNPICR
jgi:hypothetical protein